jgi:hypothetical protein
MPKTKITSKELFETLDRLEQESIEAKAELNRFKKDQVNQGSRSPSPPVRLCAPAMAGDRGNLLSLLGCIAMCGERSVFDFHAGLEMKTPLFGSGQPFS